MKVLGAHSVNPTTGKTWIKSSGRKLSLSRLARKLQPSITSRCPVNYSLPSCNSIRAFGKKLLWPHKKNLRFLWADEFARKRQNQYGPIPHPSVYMVLPTHLFPFLMQPHGNCQGELWRPFLLWEGSHKRGGLCPRLWQSQHKGTGSERTQVKVRKHPLLI